MKGAEEEEDTEIEIDETVTNLEDFVQGMNSPSRMKKHIRFSSTSSSTPSTCDAAQRGSTPPLVVTVEPLIQDEVSPRPVFPFPQAENVPPMLTPIQTITFYQGLSSSIF